MILYCILQYKVLDALMGEARFDLPESGTILEFVIFILNSSKESKALNLYLIPNCLEDIKGGMEIFPPLRLMVQFYSMKKINVLRSKYGYERRVSV